MVAAGYGWKTVLEACEWKSTAILDYISNDMIDEAAYLKATLAESDEETLSWEELHLSC